MDNLTKIVRDEISRQYRSVRQFAFAVGVPLSTITVVQMCQVLGIKALSDDAAFYLTDDTEQLLTQYAALDDYGRHTVASVMEVEYKRCCGKDLDD